MNYSVERKVFLISTLFNSCDRGIILLWTQKDLTVHPDYIHIPYWLCEPGKLSGLCRVCFLLYKMSINHTLSMQHCLNETGKVMARQFLGHGQRSVTVSASLALPGTQWQNPSSFINTHGSFYHKLLPCNYDLQKGKCLSMNSIMMLMMLCRVHSKCF